MELLGEFKKNNKILVLHSTYILSGAEKSLLELLNNVPKGLSIHVVVSKDSVIYNELLKLQLNIHLTPLVYLQKSDTIKIKLYKFLLVVFVSLHLLFIVYRYNIPVIYCNTIRVLPYCVLLRLFSFKKIIFHCRDSIDSICLRYFANLLCHKIICVSKFVIQRLNIKDKTLLIYNGTSHTISNINFDKNYLYNEYNIDSDKILIGNIGQVVPWKNQIDFIRIANNILKIDDRIHFFIIGPIIDYEYYDILKYEIRKNNMAANFTFTGYVQNMESLYRSLSIVVHTAVDEPFGRVIIECFKFKIPVVAYASGSINELIENETSGFLSILGDIESMKYYILRLLSDPVLYKSITDRAFSNIEIHYDLRKYIFNVYSLLVNI